MARSEATARIVFIGDEGCGKTSIIASLLTEAFQERGLPAVMPEAALPGDTNPEKIPTRLVDTSSKLSARATLDQELQLASVVVLVFDATDPDSRSRVTSVWLEHLRMLGITCPIRVVGNKDDDDALTGLLEAEMSDDMKSYGVIGSPTTCSARTQRNLKELVLDAQKMTLFPIAPFFVHGELSPALTSALARIFALADADHDGALSAAELNALNEAVYNMPISEHSLAEMRNKLQSSGFKDVLDSRGNFLINGFIHLQKVMIDLEFAELVWKLLRHFGYGDNLRLTQEYKYPVDTALAPYERFDLSDAGRAFLVDLFDSYTSSGLTDAQLSDMFERTDVRHHPWALRFAESLETRTVPDGSAPTGTQQRITLRGFLSQWTAYLNENPRECLAQLAMLGYVHQASSPPLQTAVVRTTTRPTVDVADRPLSHYLKCAVVGSASSNKAALLALLVRRPPLVSPGAASRAPLQFAVNYLAPMSASSSSSSSSSSTSSSTSSASSSAPASPPSSSLLLPSSSSAASVASQKGSSTSSVLFALGGSGGARSSGEFSPFFLALNDLTTEPRLSATHLAKAVQADCLCVCVDPAVADSVEYAVDVLRRLAGCPPLVSCVLNTSGAPFPVVLTEAMVGVHVDAVLQLPVLSSTLEEANALFVSLREAHARKFVAPARASSLRVIANRPPSPALRLTVGFALLSVGAFVAWFAMANRSRLAREGSRLLRSVAAFLPRK